MWRTCKTLNTWAFQLQLKDLKYLVLGFVVYLFSNQVTSCPAKCNSLERQIWKKNLVIRGYRQMVNRVKPFNGVERKTETVDVTWRRECAGHCAAAGHPWWCLACCTVSARRWRSEWRRGGTKRRLGTPETSSRSQSRSKYFNLLPSYHFKVGEQAPLGIHYMWNAVAGWNSFGFDSISKISCDSR